MSIGIDTKLRFDTDIGVYDIVVDDQGNLEGEVAFDNAILLSLFGDARADASQVTPPERRRGWWGNEINANGHEEGSLLWLLEQRRRTIKTLNEATDFARKSVQWFIDDGLAQRIDVSTRYSGEALIIDIVFYRPDNQIINKTYNLWEATEVTEKTRL